MATGFSRRAGGGGGGLFVSFRKGSSGLCFFTWGYRFRQETSMDYFPAVSNIFQKKNSDSILNLTICFITQLESVYRWVKSGTFTQRCRICTMLFVM